MTLYNLGVPIGKKKKNRTKQNKNKQKNVESGIHFPLKMNPESIT